MPLSLLLVGAVLLLQLTSESDAGWRNSLVDEPSSASEGAFESFSDTCRNDQIVFTENRGQVENDDVIFHSTVGKIVYGFMEDGLLIRHPVGISNAGKDSFVSLTTSRFDRMSTDMYRSEYSTIKIEFEGYSGMNPRGENPLSWRSNFFKGNDPSKWYTDVPNYREIIYEDIWDGIDLLYKSENGFLKYDLILRPGSDPSSIKMRVVGHEDLRITVEGELEILMGTSVQGRLRDGDLDVFYADNESLKIDTDIIVDGDIFSFQMEKYDTTREVVIDPTLYSTYVGGRGMEDVWDSALDDEGCIYIARFTESVDFPTNQDSLYPDYNGGDYDVYITKLNSSGESLDYSTFIGGLGNDKGAAIDIDDDGCAYVTGFTDSVDFPVTPGAYNTSHSTDDNDAFVLKLGRKGNEIHFSTYLGGNDYDGGYRIKVDGNGCAYMTGMTNSLDFPTTAGSLDDTYNGGEFDSFLTKFDPSGGSLVFSTFLGGKGWDSSMAIYVDENYNAYVFGETGSSDLPTTSGAFDDSFNGGERDAFLMKFSLSGDTIEYSTYLGGGGMEYAQSLVVDGDCYAYLIGGTGSNDFPTTSGAYDEFYNGGGMDAYLVKMNVSGDGLVYSTFIGGKGWEAGYGLDIDPLGYTYLIGTTGSSDFPTTRDTDHILNGLSDAFISRINGNGTSILFSRYLGGKGQDHGQDIGYQGRGYVNIAGFTTSTDFPTTDGAFDRSYNGGEYDVYCAGIEVISRPTPPRDLEKKEGDKFINITWKDPLEDGGTSPLEYLVYSGTHPSDLDQIASVNENFFNDTDLENGIRYYFEVFAVNKVGIGSSSGQISAVPGTMARVPIDFECASGDEQVTLSWLPPLDDGGFTISGYNIHRGLDEGNISLLVQKVNDNVYVDGEVENGVTYHYKIVAVNKKGRSGFSDVGHSTPGTVPEGPANLILNFGDGQVNLSWSSPIDNGGFKVNGYNIFRSSNSEEMELIATLTGSMNYTDPDVTNGIRYFYCINAFNLKGDGPRSSEICITPGTFPGPVRNLSISSGNGQVDLEWMPPVSDGGYQVTGYEIFRGRSPDMMEYLATINGTESFMDNDVNNGITYWYTVIAVNELGKGVIGSKPSATPVTVPSSVREVRISYENGSLYMTWELPEDNGGSPLTGFNIYLGRDKKTADLLSTINTTEYSGVMELGPGTYYSHIAAVNKIGEGAFSDVTSLIVREDESKDGKSDGYLEWTWIILISVIIVLIISSLVAGILVARKKKSGSRTESEPRFDPAIFK